MGLSLIFFEIMNSAPKQKPAKRQAKSTKSFKPSRRFIKRIGIALAIIVAVFGVWELGRLGGLWGDPNMLLRVKAEKISNKDLLGMELVDRKVSGYNDPLSKKVTPSIENRFKPVDGDVEKTIAKIIEFAENDGWKTYSSDDTGISRWSGRKYPKKGLILTASIYVYNDGIISLRVASYSGERATNVEVVE